MLAGHYEMLATVIAALRIQPDVIVNVRSTFPPALTALVVAVLLPRGCRPRGNDARITGERRISERVIELTIATPAFAGPTKVHVNLPVGYDAAPARRWPVTYVTAGTMNTYATFNNFLKGEKLARGHPAIIVSPNGDSGYWSDWYNAGAFGPPKYETYVIEQLIPLIDARFRTRADRSQRAIFGISMGGYGATMLAAHHPDLFAAAATLSGAVDSNLEPNGSVLSASSTFDGAPADAIYGPRVAAGGPLARPQPHRPRREPARPRPAGPHRQRRAQPGARREHALGGHGLVRRRGSGSGRPACPSTSGSTRCGMPHTWKDYGAGCHTVANFQRETLDTLAVFERVFAKPPRGPGEVRAPLDRAALRRLGLARRGRPRPRAGVHAPRRGGRPAAGADRVRHDGGDLAGHVPRPARGRRGHARRAGASPARTAPGASASRSRSAARTARSSSPPPPGPPARTGRATSRAPRCGWRRTPACWWPRAAARAR